MEAVTLRVALALIWREQRLLIARRRPGVHLAGFWEFPGGKLEPGETAEKCACREAMEELGVDCEAVQLREPVLWRYPDREVELIPVDCRYLGGPPRALQVDEWRWALPEELDETLFPPANGVLIRRLVSDR